MPKAQRPPDPRRAPLLPELAAAAEASETTQGKSEQIRCEGFQRWLAEGNRRRVFAIIIIIVFLYVIWHLVGWLFGWLFSSGSTAPAPAPEWQPERPANTPAGTDTQHWPLALCDVPVSSYDSNKDIVDKCKTVNSWESLAGISQVDDGGCFVNKTTKAIDCSRQESCHGGQHQVHYWNTFRDALSYDCGGGCKGTLRVNCCKTCKSIAQTDSFTTCTGCEEAALRNIVNKNTASCSRNANGFFSCTSKDTCLVKPQVSPSKIQHSISCAITPCNECTTPQLRAKCCSVCLAALCGHPKDRQVCSGCDPSELSKYGEAASWHMPK